MTNYNDDYITVEPIFKSIQRLIIEQKQAEKKINHKKSNRKKNK